MFDERVTSFRFANNYDSDYLNGKQMRRKSTKERNRNSYRFKWRHNDRNDRNVSNSNAFHTHRTHASNDHNDRNNRLTIAPNRGLFANGFVSNVMKKTLNDINTDMEARINEDLGHILNKNKQQRDVSSKRHNSSVHRNINHKKRKHMNGSIVSKKYDSNRNDYVQQYIRYPKYGQYNRSNKYKNIDYTFNGEQDQELNNDSIKKTKDINNKYVYKRKKSHKSYKSPQKSTDNELNQLICDENIDDIIDDDNKCNKSIQNSIHSDGNSNRQSLPKITNQFVFDFKRVNNNNNSNSNNNKRMEKNCEIPTKIPSTLLIVGNLMKSYGLERKQFAKRLPQFKENVLTDICQKLKQTAISNGFEFNKETLLNNKIMEQKIMDEKRGQQSISVDGNINTNINCVQTVRVNDFKPLQCMLMMSKVIKHVSEALDSLSSKCKQTSFFDNEFSKTNSNHSV